MLVAGGEVSWAIEGDKDRLRLSREEDLYKQEMIRLEKDLTYGILNYPKKTRVQLRVLMVIFFTILENWRVPSKNLEAMW